MGYRTDIMSRVFRKILVPHDFSAHADRALGLAVELAAGARGRLLVLHAVPEVPPVVGAPPLEPAPVYTPIIPPPEVLSKDRERLEKVVKRAIGRRTVRGEVRVVTGGAVERILEAARGTTAIVMGTIGRGGLAKLLLGSVAESVVRQAPVPVLTLRAGAHSPAGRRKSRKSARR